MKKKDTPLIIEEKDPKWELLSKIFDVVRSRRIKKEMAFENRRFAHAKIYKEILEELKRRRIARNSDTVAFDKGYYGYKNYVMGISRFKIVPLIFLTSA